MIDQLLVHGRRIEARWSGPDIGVAPPIVLLHEGLGSVRMWRTFPDTLAACTGRRVLAYSRLGHGDSDPPELAHTSRFMHEEALDRLPATLDAAGVERAVLFGHSDGGSIALIFAATYPSRVDALVLEAPHVFVEEVSIASIARMKSQYQTSDLRDRLDKYHHDVDAAFHGWNDVWLAPEFRSWNIETYLPQIVCPVLLFQGEQDEYGTRRQVDAIAAKVRGPVEMLLVPDCGHSPHRDRPAKVLEVTRRFLEP